jgi:hypothetical protein
MIGQIFGNLTVISLSTQRHNGYKHYICRCLCGQFTNARSSSLRSGNTRSCGCLKEENMRNVATKHGLSTQHKALMRRWSMMLDRCFNPRNKSYKNYGGRGITVCARWFSFENFYVDMGEPPTPGHTLERLNNDGPYSPDNCIWLLQKYQNFNRRKRNKKLPEFGGKSAHIGSEAELAVSLEVGVKND